MSSKIKAIQKDIVHKICSGQVVLNLATAIKELVENSLDAKATIIEVRLKEYGSDLIEVTDNGTGIHPDNFQALTLKHHTSKLSDFSDLVNVETFGFRGEALSSLCAVSEMVVTTRHENEECGSKLTFDYLGILQDNQPCSRQVGTTISLTNLFSSLPVRQKEFHRNLKKEFSKTVQLLTAYCLISTNVKITCTNQTKKGGRMTFLSTQENKSVRQNITCIFGPKQLSSLLEIVRKLPSEELLEEFSMKDKVTKIDSFSLEGFISSCEHGSGRSSTDRQFYYINSRPCEPSKVMKLVNEVYHHFNLHQFPFVLMNIIVPKQSVDVNVTPDKRLIFLQNENILLATVKSSLNSLYENIPSTYKLNNPLSSLPSKSTVETKKISLSVFDKWRHMNDKNTSESQKRANQEHTEQPAFKQMKLDVFKKVTEPKKPEIEDSEPQHVKIESDEKFSSVTFKIIHKNDSSSEKYLEDIRTESLNNKTDDNPKSESGDHNDTLVYEVAEISGFPSLTETFNDDIITEDHCPSETEASNDGMKTEERLANVSYKIEMCDYMQSLECNDGRKTIYVSTSVEDIRLLFKERNSRKHENFAIVNKFHAEIDPSKNSLAEEELSKAISKDMFLKMKIIGQFNLGFIITKLENDLFIVDQHATDEKYNFETLQRTTSLKSQKLVVPQSLDLTVANECVLIENIDILKKNGFEFLIDQNAEATKRVKLTFIPVSQNWHFGKEDIDEMLFMLQDAPNTLCRPSRIRAMFASRACRKSVMIGTPLNMSDMKKLICHMSEIEQPWNCPHGRPTMRHLINLSLLD